MNYVTKLAMETHPSRILDGKYKGFWGGYEVTFYVGEEIVHGTVDEGIRGLNVPCIVTARNGSLTIKEDIK